MLTFKQQAVDIDENKSVHVCALEPEPWKIYA